MCVKTYENGLGWGWTWFSPLRISFFNFRRIQLANIKMIKLLCVYCFPVSDQPDLVEAQQDVRRHSQYLQTEHPAVIVADPLTQEQPSSAAISSTGGWSSAPCTYEINASNLFLQSNVTNTQACDQQIVNPSHPRSVCIASINHCLYLVSRGRGRGVKYGLSEGEARGRHFAVCPN